MECPICGKRNPDTAECCGQCKRKLNIFFLTQETREQWAAENRREWEKEKRDRSSSNRTPKKDRPQIITAGACGNHSDWSLTNDGQLHITGLGDIDDMEKKIEKETVDDWPDYYDAFYKDWYPEYRNGVVVNLPHTEDYVHTYEKEIDTVPWRHYRDEIKSVDIAKGITGIGDNAFVDCKNLSSVHLPDTITKIGKSSFRYCDRLIIKQLPSHLTYLGDNAFLHSDGYSGCLSSNIPSTLTYIGDNAFYAREGNKSIRDVTLSGKLTYIGINAFRGCPNLSLHSKYLPSGLQKISDNAFGGCWNLRQVVLPDKLDSIGNFAFAGCHNLAEVRLPTALRRIGDSAFSGCTSLQKIEIPAIIEDICNYAFENCENLQTIVFKGEFPRKNAEICCEDALGNIIIRQAVKYVPFAGAGYIDLYCKAGSSHFWNAITSYDWGAKKIIWHRVY